MFAKEEYIRHQFMDNNQTHRKHHYNNEQK